jgi:hypothetical protein
MKRPAPGPAESEDVKRFRADKTRIRFAPAFHDINVRELTREQFIQSKDRERTPDMLRSLLRTTRKALDMRESKELQDFYSKLESISASGTPVSPGIYEEAHSLGLTLKKFIVKEVTQMDYNEYLADLTEEKMLIRRQIRLAS